MKKRYLWMMALFFWAGLIFFFSSQPYQDQNLTRQIGEVVNGEVWSERLSGIMLMYNGREISVANLGLAHFIEFFIRKGAHVGIFFIFGFLTIAVWRMFTERRWLFTLGALLFVFVYACLDEVHQFYTGDRTPLFADVVLDTIGGLLGIMVYVVLTRFHLFKRE